MTAEPQWEQFLTRNIPHASAPVPQWAHMHIAMTGYYHQLVLEQLIALKEIVMTQANVTQASLEAEASAVTALTTAWTTWASNIETILANVAAAWQAALAANPTLSSADLDAAIAAGQSAVTALPVETDPTVTPPAPAPAPAPGN